MNRGGRTNNTEYNTYPVLFTLMENCYHHQMVTVLVLDYHYYTT